MPFGRARSLLRGGCGDPLDGEAVQRSEDRKIHQALLGEPPHTKKGTESQVRQRLHAGPWKQQYRDRTPAIFRFA